MQGSITYVSGKGWFFARCHADDGGVFVHQRNVENRRYLIVGDIIEFERIPSTKNLDDFEAINVKFVAHAGALLPEPDGNRLTPVARTSTIAPTPRSGGKL
jgi:hypothetical protein